MDIYILLYNWPFYFCLRILFNFFYKLEHFSWLTELTKIKCCNTFIEKPLSLLKKNLIHYYFRIKILHIPPNQETKCLGDVIQHSFTDFSEALPIFYQLWSYFLHFHWTNFMGIILSFHWNVEILLIVLFSRMLLSSSVASSPFLSFTLLKKICCGENNL